MNKTKIEWVKNPDGSQGYTWNPITGCLNGCEYCYARKLANGRLKKRYLANNQIAVLGMPKYYAGQDDLGCPLDDPFYPRFWEERLSDPYSYGRNFSDSGYKRQAHKGIFVCDMSDLFGIGIPQDWTEQVMAVINSCSQHRFYLLTKQPQNLIKWSPFPDNCWVGVTACNQDMFDDAIHYLSGIKAKVRYISFEPLLERVQDLCWNKYHGSWLRDYLDWVIIGAQTKPTVYPKIEWVQEIALSCTKAKIPLFIKNNLKPILPNRMPFYDVVSYWSEDKTHKLYESRLRQEFPSCT